MFKKSLQNANAVVHNNCSESPLKMLWQLFWKPFETVLKALWQVTNPILFIDILKNNIKNRNETQKNTNVIIFSVNTALYNMKVPLSGSNTLPIVLDKIVKKKDNYEKLKIDIGKRWAKNWLNLLHF